MISIKEFEKCLWTSGAELDPLLPIVADDREMLSKQLLRFVSHLIDILIHIGEFLFGGAWPT